MSTNTVTTTRSKEEIDYRGMLHVPHRSNWDKAKNRPGWEPYWVSVNLDDPIQKVVVYRPDGTEPVYTPGL
jgi:hypothetical protein